MTQLPWPLDNRLVKKVEEWGKKGASAIKRGCIDFLNRNGEKFDWENDDISELEVVNEQPKLVQPGLPISWTLGLLYNFCCRGPILIPRPDSETSAQTTRGNVLDFFVKPKNGISASYTKRC